MTEGLVIYGTRPEVIKLSPVIRRFPENFTITLCNTGQQRELSRQAMDYFDIRADIDLDVMEEDQSLAELNARLQSGLARVIGAQPYDFIMVQGDTMTAFAAACIASKRAIPLFHVEAGLRSYDIAHPFPEEILRQKISGFTSLHFAPTQASVDNLISEGTPANGIILTGNTVVDALADIGERAVDWDGTPLAGLKGAGDIILITLHRKENHGERLDQILTGIARLLEEFSAMAFVLPVHPNPNVEKKVRARLAAYNNMHILAPLVYPLLLQLMKKSRLILTDSGGIQEEAPSFGVPLLILRDATERPEALSGGFAELVGVESEAIFNRAAGFLYRRREETRLSGANPFGNGRAGEKIIEAIVDYFT